MFVLFSCEHVLSGLYLKNDVIKKTAMITSNVSFESLP